MEKERVLLNKKIWVAGHNGMVGAATVRRLQQENCRLLTVDRQTLDLRRQSDVQQWIRQNKPEIIVLAAAHVGGIMANRDYPADFLYNNLAIQNSLIHAAYECDVEKLLFLGSSCIYPREAPQPIKEESLLTGPLEPTNECYAIAKIAGIKLCQAYRRQHGCDFISAMPCNLYGPGDRFDVERSHVIPAMLMKMHAAEMRNAPHVEIWGTGTPLREFLYVDDLADALVFMLEHYSGAAPLNVGSSREISIAGLAHMIQNATGYQGEIIFNTDKPDGTPRKLMDSSQLAAMGWKPTLSLKSGLAMAYQWYLENMKQAHAA